MRSSCCAQRAPALTATAALVAAVTSCGDGPPSGTRTTDVTRDAIGARPDAIERELGDLAAKMTTIVERDVRSHECVHADVDSHHVAVGAFVGADAIPFCSGTLVDPTHVLTAGHCADLIEGMGRSPARRARFTLAPRTTDGPFLALASARSDYHPGYVRAVPNAPVPVADLALVALAVPAGSARSVGRWRRSETPLGDGADVTVTAVGYGASCIDRRMRAPRIDGLRRSATMRGRAGYGLLLEYGDVRLSPCSGDSGGPVLIDGRVIAVLSYVKRPCVGAAANRIDGDEEAAWIEGNLARSPPPPGPR